MKRIYFCIYEEYTNGNRVDLEDFEIEILSESDYVQYAKHTWFGMTTVEQSFHDVFAGYIDIPNCVSVFESGTLIRDSVISEEFWNCFDMYGFKEVWKNGDYVPDVPESTF